MGNIRGIIARGSDDDLKEALTDTSRTIQQLTITLLVFAAFAVSVAGVSDIALLLTDAQIRLPTLGGMPLTFALVMGPAVLIAVRAYLQIYVVHWRRLDWERRMREIDRPMTISPMRDGLLRSATIGVRYLLVPVALAAITWKALGDPRPLGYGLLVVTVFVTILHIVQDVPFRLQLPAIALVIILLGVTAFSPIGDRYVPDRDNIRRPLSLRYAELSKRVLQGRDLRDADLRLARLIQSDLSRLDGQATDLSRANLMNADLSNADLESAILTGAYMRFANLTDAHLDSAILSYASLEQANLTDASLNTADLHTSMLSSANLSGALLKDAKLNNANLQNSNMTDTRAYFADFTDARLARASLIRTDLFEAVLFGADFTEAKFTGARLEGAYLDGANMRDADLRGVIGLTCEQLVTTEYWSTTLRDPDLDCREDKSEPPAKE